jgi:hypothetical protein
MALPSRNFLLIGQKLIEGKDEEYYQQSYLGNKYQKSRDSYFERKATAIFKKFLPDVSFYANVKYPLPAKDGKNPEMTELDILGVGSNELYLIELKAGELNEAARRGAQNSLLTRLKKNIGKGVSQSKRAADFINADLNPEFILGQHKIGVRKDVKQYRLVITLDNFAGTLGQLNMLEEAHVMNNDGDFPWIAHIYDLMIVADLIENKDDFNEFLDKRLALNSWKEFTTHDELNLLAHFLDEELEFPKKSES